MLESQTPKSRRRRHGRNEIFLFTMASIPQGFDVVGIENGSNGRNCEQHLICGQFISKSDFLYCKWAVQKIDGEDEAVVKVFKLASDGHVGCHVGYLPRRLIKASRDESGKKDAGQKYDGIWLKIVSDLRLSNNSSERARSHRNMGMLHCHVCNEPFLVGNDPFETTINLPKPTEEEKQSTDFLPSDHDTDSSVEAD